VSCALCAGALSCWNMKLCNLEWKWMATIIMKYCWRRSCCQASRKYRVTISYSNRTAHLHTGCDRPRSVACASHHRHFKFHKATDLRWGENFNKLLFRSSLLNIVVKKLRRSDSICQSYRKIKVSCFFMDHSVVVVKLGSVGLGLATVIMLPSHFYLVIYLLPQPHPHPQILPKPYTNV